MVHKHAGTILQQLRNLVGGEATRCLTDSQLLGRFITHTDEAAFATLVGRHGPHVLDVCRNVLRHEQDAEDAFQATFFVLARKAASVHKTGSLASWLHGVAYRTALKARRAAYRRHEHERRANPCETEQPPQAAALRELQALLDQEVAYLPDKYRAPFVLCCLQGKSRAEAAGELGWKEGTVSSRLALARRQLQRRLVRRGVTLSAGLCARSLAPGPGRAAVPAGWAATVARGAVAFATGAIPAVGSTEAVALAQGVLHAMMLIQVKYLVGVVLVLGLISVGFGTTAYQAAANTEPNGPSSPQLAAPAVVEAEGRPPRADRQGDPLPTGALYRFGVERFRHGWDQRGIGNSTLSPDGKLLATSAAHSVVVWDVQNGKAVHRFRCDPPPYSAAGLAFSTDSRLLGHLRNGDFACVWDLATGKEIRRFEKERSYPTTLCRFSADGKQLVLSEQKRTVFWDLEAGTEVRSFPVGRVCLLSPDLQTFLRIDDDQEVILGSVQTGQEIGHWEVQTPYNGFEDGLAFAPDGKTVAVVHQHEQIQIRETDGGKVRATFPLPESARFRPDPTDRQHWEFKVGFSADGKTLLVGTHAGFIYRWDLATKWELPPLGKHLGNVTSFHTLPDGKTLVSTGTDGVVRRWDLATAKELSEPEAHVGQTRAAYSPDGRFAAVGDERGRLELWDAMRGERLRLLRPDGPAVNNLAFSPDVQSLAVAQKDGTVAFWDIPSGRAGKVLAWKDKAGWAFASILLFSLDGKRLYFNEYPRQLFGCEVGTGTILWRQPCPSAAGLSPDGKTLLAVYPGKTLRFFDPATGAQRFQAGIRGSELDALFDLAAGVAFSPDGRQLAVSLRDRQVCLCDSQTGAEVGRFRAVDPPGKGIQAEIQRLQGNPITALAFSPDGRWLLTGGRDTTVRVWEVATTREAFRLVGHEAEVTRVGFGQDGRTVFTAGKDTQAFLWGLKPPATTRKRGLAALWNDLAEMDAGAAYRAIWALSEDAAAASRFLRQRITPVEPIDKGPVEHWIADLESEQFAVREAATKALKAVGERAAPFVEQALAARPTLEMRKRLESVLDALHEPPGPEVLRRLRAVQALELAGTPEARAVLRAWAGGAAGHHLTENAKAALVRLERRDASLSTKP